MYLWKAKLILSCISATYIKCDWRIFIFLNIFICSDLNLVWHIIIVWISLNCWTFKHRNIRIHRQMYKLTHAQRKKLKDALRPAHWRLSPSGECAGALINQTEMSQFCCGWTVWPQTCQPLHLGQHVWTHIFSTSRSFVYAINGVFFNKNLLKKKRESSQYFVADAHNVLLGMRGFS